MKSWQRIMAVMGAVWLGGAMAQAAPAAADDEIRDPVNFRLSLRADYTDNRDSVGDNEESNTDFYVTPSIDVYLHTDRTLFDFYYAPSWRYRTDPSDIQQDDEFFHDLGLNIEHDMSAQTQLRLNEHLSYQDDPSIADNGAEVRGDRSYWWNRTDAGIRHNFSDYTYVDLDGGYRLKQYDDADVAAESDEESFDAQLMLWRAISELLAVHGEVGTALYGYESAQGLERDFDSYLIAAGLDKIFSTQLRGGIAGGAQFAQYSDESLDDQVYPYVRLNATLAPSEVYRVEGSLGMGARDSDVFPFASQEYTEFRLALVIDPAPTYTLGLDGVVRLSEYGDESLPAGAVGVPAASDGDETTTAITAYGTWKIGEQTRMTLRQRYEDVDSDVEESYQKNTTSIDFSIDL